MKKEVLVRVILARTSLALGYLKNIERTESCTCSKIRKLLVKRQRVCKGLDPND